jgi:hypothetical protein
MEQYVVRLDQAGQWVLLGSTPEDKKDDSEVVVRSFDIAIEGATGSGPGAPDGDPVPVPAGEGRRLVGRHFFVRLPADATGSCRVSHRGLIE